MHLHDCFVGEFDAAIALHRVSIIDSTKSQCRQTYFDNDSGRVSDAGKPCKDGLSNDGAPVRAGTERRLDAISKSFSHK